MQFLLPTVKALSREHLRELIAENVKTFGHECNFAHIDVSSVTTMKSLFENMSFNGRTLDWGISNWDVSNVTDMSFMFYNAAFQGDLSKWNVHQVTNMDAMFMQAIFNGDISNWNMGNLRTMGKMFAGSMFNGNISHWNVSKVEDMSYLFHNSKFNGDISGWNLSSLTKCHSPYNKSNVQNHDIPNPFIWLLGFKKPTELKPEWQEHLVKVKSIVEALYPDELDAAKACQSMWLSRDMTPQSEPADINVAL